MATKTDDAASIDNPNDGIVIIFGVTKHVMQLQDFSRVYFMLKERVSIKKY